VKDALVPVAGTTRFTPEMTRAAKTRLSRYGFADVMNEGVTAGIVLPPEQKDVVVRGGLVPRMIYLSPE
jgi:hypothetical protein